MSGVLNSLGWVPLPPNRTVVLCVADLDACPYATHVVARWRTDQPRTSFFLIAGDEKARSWLSTHCDEPVINFPINSAPTSLLFVLMTRVRVIMSIGDPSWLPARLLGKAYEMGVPLILTRFSLARSGPSQDLVRMGHLVDWWEPLDRVAEEQLKSFGIPADRIAAVPELRTEPSPESWTVLKQLSARRPPVRRRLQQLVMRGLEQPFWRKLIERRAKRLNSIEEFRDALGRPQTILCLGNGPSCEDPVLEQYAYDALFRVNYRWRSRGRFTKADVVFTGQKRTLFSVHPRIFAFQTQRAEAQLITHHIFNPLCRPMRYVTLERLGVLGGETWDRIRPTNGATMIAAAVAIRPQKLIIGGIDLFENPAGAYPGDTATPNAYVAVHDPGTELRYILETLAGFRGEVIIIGEILKRKVSQGSSQLEAEAAI
jgi:hypothetical protein